jgi:hypothetical protein
MHASTARPKHDPDQTAATNWRRRLLWPAGTVVISLSSLLAIAQPANATIADEDADQVETGCLFEVADIDGIVGDEVKAVRLQEGGTNEIYLRVDGVRFPQTFVRFSSNGQGRSARDFGNPVASIQPDLGGAMEFQLWEDDGFLADDLIEPDLNVFCDPSPGQRTAKTVRFDDIHSRAIYDVEMVVSRPSA